MIRLLSIMMNASSAFRQCASGREHKNGNQNDSMEPHLYAAPPGAAQLGNPFMRAGNTWAVEN